MVSLHGWTRPLIVRFLHILMFCCLSGGGPFWLAMEGRTYHRVFSTDSNQYEHPAQWLLYDASGRSLAASSRNVPSMHYRMTSLNIILYIMFIATLRNMKHNVKVLISSCLTLATAMRLRCYIIPAMHLLLPHAPFMFNEHKMQRRPTFRLSVHSAGFNYLFFLIMCMSILLSTFKIFSKLPLSPDFD